MRGARNAALKQLGTAGPRAAKFPRCPRLRASDEKRHAPPPRMRAAHPQGENSGNTRSRRVDDDSACSYSTRPFQSLGAHPASEHRCSVLDSDRFGHESARIHRWSITAASRGAPRRARTESAPRLQTQRTRVESDQKGPPGQNCSGPFCCKKLYHRNNESPQRTTWIEKGMPASQLREAGLPAQLYSQV